MKNPCIVDLVQGWGRGWIRFPYLLLFPYLWLRRMNCISNTCPGQPTLTIKDWRRFFVCCAACTVSRTHAQAGPPWLLKIEDDFSSPASHVSQMISALKERIELIFWIINISIMNVVLVNFLCLCNAGWRVFPRGSGSFIPTHNGQVPGTLCNIWASTSTSRAGRT